MAPVGYARVSTVEQDLALQTDALRKAGCERVFEDAASGAKADRPGLAVALAYLREGAPATPSCTSSPAWSRR
jgi:DNA invertase Pin-like site-specific DNA recombinase